MITVFEDAYTAAYYKTGNGRTKMIVLADRDRAINIFRSYFKIDPVETTCDCCYSMDFFIEEWESVEEYMEGNWEEEVILISENACSLRERWG